jgi:PDZ domain-containing secreted protein
MMQPSQKTLVLFLIISLFKTSFAMFQNCTNRLSLLFVIALMSNALIAQETLTRTEKKVVVTIRGKDASGADIYRKIVKSGEEAANFDTEKYIKDNTKDIANPTVDVSDKDELNEPIRRKHNNYQTYTYNYNVKNDNKATNNKSKQGFLGVSDDGELANGVSVTITSKSGADKAGLKNGDVLLQLNETPIRAFRDVSTFMRTTKPNDNVQVKYERDGAVQTTTVTLGEHETHRTYNYNYNYNNNYNYTEKEKEACLGVYSSTYRGEGKRGTTINDFTPVSAAKDEKMQVGDVITAVNAVSVKNHQELWDEIAKYKPKQIVTVYYTRNNEPMRVNASLKACKPKDDDVILVPEVKAETAVINPNLTEQRTLKLNNFSASPNPIQDMVQIQFQGEAVPTVVALYDLSGRVLYQQSLTDFSGDYNQRFDVSAYAKGGILVQIVQDKKVFAKKLVVN